MQTIDPLKRAKLKLFLDKVAQQIERPGFIKTDPVQFMYRFDHKKDQELAGFFAAIMAWGRRDIVIKKVDNLLLRMDYRPAEFIRNFTDTDARRLVGFKHRTFKPVDLYWIVRILKSILKEYDDFESFWLHCLNIARSTDRPLMGVFHEEFFKREPNFSSRTRKHISNAEKNSACKRLYLYLKWCLRKESSVDPGIMDFMDPADLKIPLDVHVARQARRMGLLTRKYNDWKAVEELTRNLQKMDRHDPVKYDYALFGIGVDGYSLPPDFYVNKVN